jgi:hypothetical protein
MRDDFDKKIKSRLENLEGEVPDGLLDDIKAEMDRRGLEAGRTKRRKASAVFWTLAAAAAVAGIMVVTDPWAGKDSIDVVGSGAPVAESASPETSNETASTIENKSDVSSEKEGGEAAPVQASGPSFAAKASPAAVRAYGTTGEPAATSDSYVAEASSVTSNVPETTIEPDEAPESEIAPADGSVTEQDSESELGKEPDNSMTLDEYLRQSEDRKKRPHKIYVSAYSAASGSSSSSSDGLSIISSSRNYIASLNEYKGFGIMATSAGKNSVPHFDDGDLKHHMPITAGLMAAIPLTDNLFLSIGGTYSFLHSEESGSLEDADQKLHYIGIPLQADYTFWRKGRFKAYAALGGQIQWLVSGKIRYGGKNYSLTEENPQLSAMASAGASVDLFHGFSFFVEPGAVYYFDNGGDICNIYEEKPFEFRLNAGIRYSIDWR